MATDKKFTAAHPDAVVFCREDGSEFVRVTVNRYWRKARRAEGLDDLLFHDLRRTGNTFAAATPGPSTKELMVRMGHSSPAAALRYRTPAVRRTRPSQPPGDDDR